MAKRKSEVSLPNYISKKDIFYRDYKGFEKEISGKDIEKISEEELVYIILDYFYSMTRRTANTLTAFQIDLLVKKLQQALSTKSKFEPIITYNKVKYGFIPDWTKINFAELVDMETCLKNDDYISLMSILYRPIVEKRYVIKIPLYFLDIIIKTPFIKRIGYAIEEYKGYNEELFNNVTLDVVDNFKEVFTKSKEDLRKHTQSSTV